MAYATSNPPKVVASAMVRDDAAESGQIWIYADADAVGTVDTADYFSNGDALGMKVGDIMWVWDSNTPLLTPCYVSAVTSGGAATVIALVTT